MNLEMVERKACRHLIDDTRRSVKFLVFHPFVNGQVLYGNSFNLAEGELAAKSLSGHFVDIMVLSENAV